MEEMIKAKKIIDGEISIATGKSKKEISWKNKSMKWSALVSKLKNTTRTPETYEEYKHLSKSDRDNIKDVGGFVGGTLKEGRRKAENVANRTLLTLDMDHVQGDVWASIEISYEFAVLMYSTHSHSPKNPRYRLIIPLLRPVLPDEYQAIARMVASDLGIDFFDDTTYEPSRLMYWPSTAADGEYVFRFQDGHWLDPDKILARYTFGWQDVSYWPESSRQRAKLMKAVKKQEDPLNKKGIIGAFCRTYDIHQAIDKYLNDVYIPTADPNRYTFVEGSTTAGVVIYDDKFSFSHHGTDPASGMLCNAFDLVRVHKFSDTDESLSKMQELATADESVRVTIGQEKIEKATQEFDTVEDEDNEKWLSKLEYTQKGTIKNTINNIRLIIENDPMLKGKIAYNEFANRAEVRGKLPWRSKDGDWKDSDDAGLRHHLENCYGVSSVAKTNDALMMIFEKSSYHPIKDYFSTLVWDKKTRVETLLIDFLGAEDNEYVKTVTKKVLVAAVKRIFEPGCKFDNVLTLSGGQGWGKSTLVRKLGVNWYSDSLTTVSGKEAYEQLQGSWIIEMAEMNATKKADIEATKHFLSKCEDIYRVAYGRRTSRFPRQCIFIGTSNEAEYLRDVTGNRRFWPVDVGIKKPIKNIFTDDLNEYEVGQIWAEAIELYKNGESIFLTKDQEKLATEHQNVHTAESPKSGMVREYLDRLIPSNWYEMDIISRRNFIAGDDFADSLKGEMKRDRICVMEVWCELFGGDPKQLKLNDSREINDILARTEGWDKSKSTLSFGKYYGKQRAYYRK